MISPTTLRQQMASAPVELSSQACMSVVSTLQHYGHKGAMLSGLTSAFILVSELTGISVPDMCLYAKNVMSYGDSRYPQYRAVGEFLKHEVLK